jgi:signal peptidase II
VDRIRSPRGVVDFIDIGVGTVRFWTFNVADSAVTVGAVMLGWVLLQEDRQRQRASD